MGQDRFKALKIVMQRAQMNNCPVAAVKTTLYKDAVSERKVFANEFQNKGDRKVTSVSVRISCFDENVKLVGTIKNYEYNDLEIMPGETFGEAKFIACPSDSIQSFAVVVTNVELEDDYYWSESTGKVMEHYHEPEIVVEMAPEVPMEDMPVNEPEVKEEVSESDLQIEVEESLFEGSAYPGSADYSSVNVQAPSEVAPSVPQAPTSASSEIAPSVPQVSASAPSEVAPSTPQSSVSTSNATQANSVVSNVTENNDEKTGSELSNDKKPKNKKIIKGIITAVVVAVIAALLVGAYFAYNKYRKFSDYNRGAAYMTNGNYDYAITVYSRLGNYKDSQKLLGEARVAYAQSLANNGSYEEAIAKFKELGGQEDKINECYSAWVDKLCSENKFDEAMAIASGDGVEISEDVMKILDYQIGKAFIETKDYSSAIEHLNKVGKYEDTEALLKEANYNLAMNCVAIANYDGALDALEKSKGYKDTDKQMKKVIYMLGKRYLDTKDYEKALTYYEKIKDYEDVSTLIPQCYYEKASILFNQKDYQKAKEYYKLAGEYEDSAEKYIDCLYESLLTEIKTEVTMATMDKFAELPNNFKDTATIVRTLNRYVEHVGAYKWSTSNDKEVNDKGGFEENIIVKLAYDNNEVVFTVDGHPVNLTRFAYESGTTSDSYYMLNTTTITRTFNGKTHTYKKIVE